MAHLVKEDITLHVGAGGEVVGCKPIRGERSQQYLKTYVLNGQPLAICLIRDGSMVPCEPSN